MQTLIKRLELIKSCILLGDEELIPNQLAKLPASDDAQVLAIVAALHTEQYAQAMSLIEQFLSRHSGLVLFDDSIKAGLKLELKRLEATLLQLNEDKNTAQQLLSEFNRRYHIVLGDVLQAILVLNYQIAAQKSHLARQAHQKLQRAKADIAEQVETLKAQVKDLQNSELDDAQIEQLHDALNQLRDAKYQHQSVEEELDAFEESLKADQDYQRYQQAKQDKADFEEEAEEIIAQHVQELSAEDKARLKKAYRQAAKRCHPDTVTEQYKAQAHHIMSELNLAYEKQDIAEVERILLLLESGAGFVASSDGINDSQQLQQKIAELHQHIAQLQSDIDAFTQDPSYQRVQALEDWDMYFDDVYASLEQERQTLEAQYQQLLSAEPPKPTPVAAPVPDEEDAYWSSEF